MSIAEFLDKFRRLTEGAERQKEIFITAAKEEGIALLKDEVRFEGTTAFVAASPLKKNELLIKKENLILRFNASSAHKLRDIR
ncbi:hypothetical protein KW797_01120 [Candidatus Parcubacteria bacterium]|nr:hypothetical protein [Candidatus Parcubacteria bacterium]